MKSITRAMLIACLVLPVIACGKKEEPQQVEAAPVAVPTTEDKVAATAAGLSDLTARFREAVDTIVRDEAYSGDLGPLTEEAFNNMAARIADLVIEQLQEVI